MPAPQLSPEGVYVRRSINQRANNKPRVNWRGDLFLRVVKIFLHDINLARFGDEQTIVRERKFIKANELGELVFLKFPDLRQYYEDNRRDGVTLTSQHLFDRLFNMYYSRDKSLASPFCLSTEHVDRDPNLLEVAPQARALFKSKQYSPISIWDVLKLWEKESGPEASTLGRT